MANATTEVIEYREGTDPTHMRKLSGQTTYGNIILKWGVTDSTELWNWFQTIVQLDAMGNRKNLSITLIEESGADKARWEIVEAWPVRYAPGELNALSNNVSIEELEIAAESMKRVK
jgi:phage tail-like protein